MTALPLWLAQTGSLESPTDIDTKRRDRAGAFSIVSLDCSRQAVIVASYRSVVQMNNYRKTDVQRNEDPPSHYLSAYR